MHFIEAIATTFLEPAC